MTPRRALLLLSLLAAAPLRAAAASPEAALLAKVQAAFERGDAVAQALKPDEAAKLAAAADPALPRDLKARLQRVTAFQAVAAPALPSCPRTPQPKADASSCVREAARAAAADLVLTDPKRVEAAAALYAGRWLVPAGSTAEQRAAAQAKADAQAARQAAASAARARAVMTGRFGPPTDPSAGAPGSGAAPANAPAGRTAAQAIAEATAGGAPRSGVRPVAAVPSLADRLRQSAAEDEQVLHYGGDDGSWSTAIGRTVTQVKKGTSGFLSFLVDGDTWKRTGSAAVDLASHPVDTVRYLPGGIAEGARALWHGVQADISVASGELSEFIDHPTPYQGVAVIGATAAAVSNAFVGAGSGAKTVVRQAAKEEIAVGVRSASRYSKALIGSADLDLDFTKAVANADAGDQIRAGYTKFTAAGRAETAPAPTGLKGRIGVTEDRFAKIDELKRQRAQDCARYGITACAIGNGQDLTLGQVKDASAEVLVEGARERVARLEAMKASGTGDAAAIEAKLADARSHLQNMEFFPSTSGLGVSDIKATLDRLQVPHRSLGFDSQALSAVKSGDVATFRAANAAMRQEIDTELLRGNAVMAAIYTGLKEGDHTQHAITVLGKGRAADGGIVYQVFDSNVGRVSLMPADSLTAYGGVVVGKL